MPGHLLAKQPEPFHFHAYAIRIRSMSRRSQNSDASVSLFPFLAVLVCAMGALIFLLLVTVKQIREQAHQKQKEKQILVENTDDNDEIEIKVNKPESTNLPDEIETATVKKVETSPATTPIPSVPIEPDDFPIAEVVPVSLPEKTDDELIAEAERIRQHRIQEQQDELDADWSNRLSRIRDDLEVASQQSTAVDDERQLLKKRLEQKVSELESLRSQIARANTNVLQDKSEVKDVETESLAVMDDIQQLRQKLDEARKTKKQAGSKYQFIPYDGVTGTTRRPIFIECNEKGLQFQPEGVTITAADVQGFSSFYNPVLIGTRALVHFWKQTDARNRSSGEPYVLLVVKPEGTMAFYAARKLLKELRVPYGYELVEAEFPLDYPDKNNDAEKALKEAIIGVLQQRNKVATSILGEGDAATDQRGHGFSRPESPLKDHPSGTDKLPPMPGRLSNTQKAGNEIGNFPSMDHAGIDSIEKNRSTSNSQPGNSSETSSEDFPTIEPIPQLSQNLTEQANTLNRFIPPSPNQRSRQQPDYRVTPQFSQTRSSENASTAGSYDATESAFNGKQQWGVQNQSAKIGVEKTVRIQIEPHQITVGNLSPIAVGKGESAEQLQEEVLKRIEKYARSWGAPPRSFYWSPCLKCEISPGGNRHFDRIENRFRQLNLKTVAEPVFIARPDFIESLR